MFYYSYNYCYMKWIFKMTLIKVSNLVLTWTREAVALVTSQTPALEGPKCVDAGCVCITKVLPNLTLVLVWRSHGSYNTRIMLLGHINHTYPCLKITQIIHYTDHATWSQKSHLSLSEDHTLHRSCYLVSKITHILVWRSHWSWIMLPGHINHSLHGSF